MTSPATYVPCKPLNAGFLDGPDALGAKVVAASLANLDTWFAAFKAKYGRLCKVSMTLVKYLFVQVFVLRLV